MDSKSHWEKIYETKRPEEVSWTQSVPAASLGLVEKLNLPASARIIDIGAGESTLVDHLLERGYFNITILDISEHALERARRRLGDKGTSVRWIVQDVTKFQPNESYDLWHDRAAFHFLTSPVDIAQYCSIARNALAENGFMIVATFSTDGPKKCSGLEIARYSEESLSALLEEDFEKITCHTEDHLTPFGTKQNFLFCLFRKRSNVRL